MLDSALTRQCSVVEPRPWQGSYFRKREPGTAEMLCKGKNPHLFLTHGYSPSEANIESSGLPDYLLCI